MAHNSWTNRRASDTNTIQKRRRSSQIFSRLSLPVRLDQLPKPTDAIWTGPEELLEGRLIAKKAGFLPAEESLRLKTQPTVGNNFWRKQKLDVIETESGKPFAGGARVKVHSEGFDLIDRSSKVVVKCYEEVDEKLNQRAVLICSTESLIASDEPVSRKPVFYKWFKASLDTDSSEITLDLWSGSRFYPLWYTDTIEKGEDVSFKTIADDDLIGKIGRNEVMSLPGVDPAVMICLSVAVQRLTTAPDVCPTEEL